VSRTKADYKSKKILMRMLAAVMSMLLLVSAFPQIESAKADSDGMIRVKLTRLGSAVTSVTMTTVGAYTVNGASVSSGSTVKVTKSGSTITLSAGGRQMASGSSVSMKRVSGGTGTGVKFTSPSLSNLFCGDLTFSVSGSSIQTVLSTYIETYLYGVVPHEMSNSFPLEALKAQAVAARTYAMRAKRSGGSYDVTDNTSSQVFRGYSSSYANAIAAVDGTRGVVLMSGSSYAQCYYTASNGGQIESSSNAWGGSPISYLKVKDDPYDRENPNSITKSYLIPRYPQKKALNSRLEEALIAAAASQLEKKGLSTKTSDVNIQEIISVEPHTPKYATPSRTYTMLRFTMKLTSKSNSTGNQVSTQVEVSVGTYSQLQSMLSLSINSADNEVIWVDEESDGFLLSFGRYGHGIGLSQRGAQWMAKEYKKTYSEILEFYYPGVKQTKLSLNEVIGGVESAPEPTRAPVVSEDGYRTLQEGDSGSEVKALQNRLKELGYFTGTPLGNYKTLTAAAVRAYQKAMGLKEDGIATPALQKMIFADQQGTPTPVPTTSPEQPPAAGQTSAVISLGDSSSRVNVREKPNASSELVGSLKHGEKVEVLAVNGEWRRIRARDITGYVMAKYLKYTNADQDTGTGYTTLQYGDSGEEVRALQLQLQRMGYFSGATLGNYKSQTEAAVKAYQKAMGLKEDGIATPELQEMIFSGRLPEVTVKPDATPVPESGISAVVSLGNPSSRLNIRQQADTESKVVGTLKHGAKVIILSSTEGWSCIRSGDVVGYVKSTYLIASPGVVPTVKPQVTPKPTPAPTPSHTQAPTAGSKAIISLSSSSSRLNVREKASAASDILGTLRHGTQVEVLGTSGAWSQIRGGGLNGYVMSEYLKVTAAATPTPAPTQPGAITGGVATIRLSSSSSRLNVRREATTSSAIAGTLKHGVQVEVLGSSGDWTKIRSGSLTGYVLTSYLSQSAVPAPQPTQTPSAGSEYRTLSYGDSGEAVKKLQKRLKELGYFSGQIAGNYLKLTRAAVEAYQQANGWTVDGIATPQLQKEIFEAATGNLANATVKVGADSYLYLRKKPDADSSVVARMKNGTRIYVTGSSGDWYQLQTSGGLSGYAKMDYIVMDD